MDNRAGETTRVRFLPWKGAISLFEKGGFTGWKAGERSEAPSLFAYENQASSWAGSTRFHRSCSWWAVACISHRRQRVKVVANTSAACETGEQGARPKSLKPW